MTDEQNAKIYQHYTKALEDFRKLPAEKQTKVPEWTDSVNAIVPPDAPKPAPAAPKPEPQSGASTPTTKPAANNQ